MPLAYKSVLNFACERDAVQASSIFSELAGFEAFPMVVCESQGDWSLECYDEGKLAAHGCDGIREISGGIKVLSVAAVLIPDLDWVTETQRLLPPVRAGRFIVHGSHDRTKVCSKWSITIDAGRAFGTAHHGTTAGCLRAIDRLARVRSCKNMLDLGTGSGVLAIAAAKAFSHSASIAAVDIDPVAVQVARENCRRNGVAGSVAIYRGDGRSGVTAGQSGRFDLVIANILAKPLLGLAPTLRRLSKPGGAAILSGLLAAQTPEVAARYRACGFCHLQTVELDGWVTLVMKRLRR